ncbi:MAG: O-antigen ligase family protein [Elusimicrobiales bacterium]
MSRLSDRAFAVYLAAMLAAYPLLRGGMDVWSQTIIQSALLGGFCVWVVSALPARVTALPLCAAVWWLACWALSPAPGLCREAALNWITGIAVFYCAALLPDRERGKIFSAAAAVSWFMLAVAAYQLLRGDDMTGSFANRNVFADWLLLIAPAMLARGKWFQAAAFIAAIALTRSRAALAALALIFIFRLALSGGILKKAAALAGALLLGAAAFRADIFSLVQRLGWWQAALDMIRARPLAGFGPGTYGFVYPAFHVPGSGEFSSIWAHCYPLQLAAETGVMATAVWLGWIVWRLRPAFAGPQDPGQTVPVGAREAVAAGLVMSLGDYALAAPPVFLLFCWWLGCLAPSPRETPPDCARPKIPSLIFGLCAAALAVFACTRQHDMDVKLIRARSLSDSGRTEESFSPLREICARHPGEPSAALMLARAYGAAALSRKDGAYLADAAAAYEEALRRNPFHPAVYDELAKIYSLLGDKRLVADVYIRKASWIKWWQNRG